MSKERQISKAVESEPTHPSEQVSTFAPEQTGGTTMESQSTDEQKAVWSTAYKNDLPDSSFLYIESGGKKDQDGRTIPRSLRHFPVVDASGKPDAIHLRNAISQASKAKDKDGKLLSPDIVARVQKKARGMLEEMKKESDVGFWRTLYEKAREKLFGAKVDKPFYVWKDANSGRYWWFAIYSNNYRDNDNPPEILSAEAHKNFVKMVDAGEWQMPELWLWHVPGSRVGEAKFVAYDEENGFALSAGVFDESKEFVAERLSTMNGISVSHGMPAPFIEREAADPLTITAYRTREISPLPSWAAANKATSFIILQKEKAEMLPDEKVKFLQDLGLNVDDLDGSLKTVAEMLNAAGIPSKEASVEAAESAVEAVEPVDAADKVEDAEPKDAVDADAAKDEAPVADAEPKPEPVAAMPDLEVIAAAVKIGVEAAVAELTGEIKGLKDKIAEMEAEKEAEELSPAASFADLLRSAVIGAKETKLDGRTTFSKDGPAENPNVTKAGDTPFDVVNLLKGGGDWRQALN